MSNKDNKQLMEIARFSLPVILELILFSMISVVNLVMVGRLGSSALSAVGLTSQPVNISLAVFQSFNVGATALIARFIGAKDYKNAQDVIIQTLQISIVLGAIITFPVYLYAKNIVTAMGGQSDSLVDAVIYMRYMAIGLTFQVIPLSISSLLRGAGDSRTPMIINIITNIINVIVGYILIFGNLGFPQLGVEGAGIAATIAKIVSTILGVILLFKTKLPIRLGKHIQFGFNKDLVKRIINIGSASALEQIVLRIGFFVYTKTIADLGTLAFAAHQICLSISNLSTNFGHALGMTSTSFTGRYLGAKKPDIALNYIRKLILFSLIISVVISIVFIFFGKAIAQFYTPDIEVITILIPVLITLAIINPAQNSLLVVSGALKGAGDTIWPLLTTLIGLTLIRIPLVILFVKHLGFGLNGAWIAAAVEKYISLLIFRKRFKSGKWNKRVI